ncbi:hypothetical protein ZOSMA_207G00010 [Zostera marina]|uniref:Uncharacterized protein n=1 Tax=Zostera marina TaxID=29655 RepID=A0A0K9PLC2_ZOSMR|nr:hypothetical protein ZOSMA_207G00010 [Zostera marina]
MAYAGGGGRQVLSPPAAARVHCSICGKLLPKLDGSKVYRCGDCNAAAIQAKGTPPPTVSVKVTTERKSSKFLVGTSSVKKEKEPSSFGSSSAVASEKGGSFCHGSNTSRSDSGEESRIVGSSFTTNKLNSDCTAKCKETQIGSGNGNTRYRRISKPMPCHSRSLQEEETRERELVSGAMDSPTMPTSQFFPPLTFKHPDQHPSEILTKIDVIRDQLSSRPSNKNPNPLPITSSYTNLRRLPYEQHLNPIPSGVPESSYHHHHHQPPLQCSCQQCHNFHWQLHQPTRTLPSVVPDSYMFSSMDLLASGGYSQLMRIPKKSLSRNIYKRECRPFAHGSPFIMCYNCFELLQFPCDLLLNGRDLNRVECGSCSQVIKFKLIGKHLVVESEDGNKRNESAGNPSSLYEVEEGKRFGIDDPSNYENTTYNGPSLHDILFIPSKEERRSDLSSPPQDIEHPVSSPPPSSDLSSPTIEKLKQGFGMRRPRVAAA